MPEGPAPHHIKCPGIPSRKQKPGDPFLLGIASYNCQTLRNRRNFVQTQFQQDNLHIIGLQETRDRKSYQVAGADYLGFHSAASAGQGGCAIWCKKQLGRLRLSFKDFSTLEANPELLVVRLSLDAKDLLLVTGHAPHSAQPVPTIEAWWDKLSDVLRRHQRATDLPVICVDANAQVGSQPGAAIGCHAAEEENASGQIFKAFLEVNQLWAPATFAGRTGDCCSLDGEAYTWTSPLGFKHRIDYIVFPESFKSVVSTWTDDAFSSDRAPDHRATYAKVAIATPERSEETAFPRLPFKTAEQVRANVPKLPAVLSRTEQVPWNVNVHCHADLLDNRVRQTCCREKRQARPIKPFLSPETFQVLRTVKSAHATLKSTDKACARLELRQFFRLWRDAANALLCPGRIHRCRLARARRHIQLGRLQKELASRLRQDKRRYIIAMSDKYANATSEKDQKALFQALQCLRPTPSKGKSKPWCSLQVLTGDDQQPVADYAAKQSLFRNVFAAQEGGWQLTPEAYCQEVAVPSLGGGSHYRLQDLPTLLQLEQAIHGMSDGKAPGPAGIGPAFWKAHVAKSAKALLPVILKSHVRLTEPVQNRQTLLISMFKQAGAACDPRSYRSIALLNPTAKIAHKLLRPGLVEELQRTAEPLHQGCQPGSYGIALSHYVMTHARIADARKMSWAVFFLDLSAAYYRLLRESLHGMGDDLAIAHVLHRLKVPPSTIDEVRSFASSTVILDKASPHLRRMVAAVTHGTYFAMDAVPGITSTAAGSRPGDSIADALFALAASHMLMEVKEAMCEAFGGAPASPAWADDLCWPLAESHATSLLHKLETLVALVHKACTRRAMVPNYKSGKSEALVRLQGKGSVEAKRALFGARHGRLSFQSSEGTQQIGCVQKYRHLGTLISVSLKSLPDARRKLGMALAVAGPLTTPVLRRPDVPLPKRAEILRTLALTKATYTVAAWGPQDSSEVSNWAAGITKLLRLLFPEDRHTDHPTFPAPADVWAASGQPSPAALLRLERLGHVVILAKGMQEALWRQLEIERDTATASWWQMAEQDVTWLNQACASLRNFQQIQGLRHWFDLSVHDPQRSQRWLRKARAAASSEAKFEALARKQAAKTPMAQPQTPVASLLSCSLCDMVFQRPQQLCVHRANKHGIRPPIEAFAGSSTCRACLMDFRTRKRLIRHLHHDAPDCALTLQALGRLSPTELAETRRMAAEFNTEDRASGWSLPAHTLPVFRRPGPLPRRAEACLDPAVLAVGSELVDLASKQDMAGFCFVVRDNIELLINADEHTFIFVQHSLPDGYSSRLDEIKG